MINDATENVDRKKCLDVVLWFVCVCVWVCLYMYDCVSVIKYDLLEVNLFLMKAKEVNKGHPFSRDPKATLEFLSICCS